LNQKEFSLPSPHLILGDLADQEKTWPEVESESRAGYLRETAGHIDLLRYFTKICVTAAVFKSKSETKMLSKYMSAALEAFLVMVYVNNHDSWLAEYQASVPGTAVPEPAVLQKSPKWFTANSRGKGKYKGWTKEGMDLYNEVMRVITVQRSNKNYSVFDTKLMKAFVGDNNNKAVKEAKDEVRAKNSLMDLYPYLRDKCKGHTRYEDSDEELDQDDDDEDDDEDDEDEDEDDDENNSDMGGEEPRGEEQEDGLSEGEDDHQEREDGDEQEEGEEGGDGDGEGAGEEGRDEDDGDGNSYERDGQGQAALRKVIVDAGSRRDPPRLPLLVHTARSRRRDEDVSPTSQNSNFSRRSSSSSNKSTKTYRTPTLNDEDSEDEDEDDGAAGSASQNSRRLHGAASQKSTKRGHHNKY
jgi:hypothetical protein